VLLGRSTLLLKGDATKYVSRDHLRVVAGESGVDIVHMGRNTATFIVPSEFASRRSHVASIMRAAKQGESEHVPWGSCVVLGVNGSSLLF